ncbi:MAG TPA: hypothetical protein VH063_15200 [Gaiellaceae bacterium]|jgi:hypothetical protein|nr:hypothetical protein [Gaiellaceae bacterium]
MRIAVAAVVAGLVTAVASTAQAAFPSQSASVAASTYKPGARSALTFQMNYLMQCGNPGAGPLVLKLPTAIAIPASLGPSSVLVNGSPAASLKKHGSTLTVGIPQKTAGITCDVVALGKLTVVIPRAAGLHNPKANGIYSFRVTIGPLDVVPKIRISG